MIVIHEYHGVVFTVEGWEDSAISIIIEVFEQRPYRQTLEYHSVAEAVAYCKKFLDDCMQALRGRR